MGERGVGGGGGGAGLAVVAPVCPRYFRPFSMETGAIVGIVVSLACGGLEVGRS